LQYLQKRKAEKSSDNFQQQKEEFKKLMQGVSSVASESEEVKIPDNLDSS
jgi:hypothetical protein